MVPQSPLSKTPFSFERVFLPPRIAQFKVNLPLTVDGRRIGTVIQTPLITMCFTPPVCAIGFLFIGGKKIFFFDLARLHWRVWCWQVWNVPTISRKFVKVMTGFGDYSADFFFFFLQLFTLLVSSRSCHLSGGECS
jgi:hypothetical protein